MIPIYATELEKSLCVMGHLVCVQTYLFTFFTKPQNLFTLGILHSGETQQPAMHAKS